MTYKKVSNFLNRKFLEKWINRCGLVTWSPRSPDFTPLDSFSFGGTSGMLFTFHHFNHFELSRRIRDAVDTAALDLLKNV